MKVQVEQKELLGVIDHVVDKTFQMDMTWDWPCGVAFYGVATAYEVTRNKAYLEKLIAWFDEYIEIGLPTFTINTCAMGHALLTLYEATGDDRYMKVINDKIDFLQNKAIRFGDHVLQHTVSSKNDFPEQAWADTLFMAAYFMLRVGVHKKDQVLIEDALNQYYWHIKYLIDPVDSLWYHGYNNINQDHMSGFYWGRANAWAAYTMSKVKHCLKDWYLYPKCMDIECALRDQLASLKNFQTDKGLWRTIVNDKEAYEEVSASCGIAAAMINNRNPLHGKYIDKAWEGIWANISSDGRVLNVSGGTAVMRDKEGYQSITKDWIQGWGQGLALAFLSATLQIQRDREIKADISDDPKKSIDINEMPTDLTESPRRESALQR